MSQKYENIMVAVDGSHEAEFLKSSVCTLFQLVV